MQFRAFLFFSMISHCSASPLDLYLNVACQSFFLQIYSILSLYREFNNDNRNIE
jgi:hypothetical protein